MKPMRFIQQLAMGAHAGLPDPDPGQGQQTGVKSMNTATPRVIETRNQHLTRDEFNDPELFIRTVTWFDMEWFRNFNDKSHIYWREDGVKVYIQSWDVDLREVLSREDSPFTYVNTYHPDGRLMSKHIEFHREEYYGRCWYIFKDNKFVEERQTPTGFERFARPMNEIRDLFLEKTKADMFDKRQVQLVVRGDWVDQALVPLFPYYIIYVQAPGKRNEGIQYLVQGETGEILFKVRYFPMGAVYRGPALGPKSAEIPRIEALLKEKVDNPFPLYAVYRKEYRESQSRFYDVFVKKETPPQTSSNNNWPILGAYFVDFETGKVMPMPDHGAEHFGPMGTVEEEYQTHLMILDIEKKEKEAKEKKETSWFFGLFHRKV
jgi:hypothetical protein